MRSVNPADLEMVILENEIVFLDFWAPWCVPCKSFGIIYDKVANDFPDIAFLSLNLEEFPEAQEPFGILSIPHLIVFKQGMVVFSESGSMSESGLRELVVNVEKLVIEG